MLGERAAVLRGVEAVAERGHGVLEGGVGDRGLERGERFERRGSVGRFDVAERASGAGPQPLDEDRQGQATVLRDLGAEAQGAEPCVRRRS